MKKLLALLISLMMAVSLAVPAFAMEAVFPISAPVDGMDDSWDEDFDSWDEDYDWWAEEREYLDSHPGLEEQLRASAYDYFEAYYYYWDSPEEYMEMWGYTEEEFLEQMVLEQVSDLIWAEQYQQYIDAQKEAMGGVPGQLGVMVNGQYIQFSDAVPEITGGRTMVPVRALVEGLGGEVDYQNKTVRFMLDGREYGFVIGSTTVTVSAAGIPVDTIEMDVAPYIKNDRTYVPIRFIGEALGYQVGWDSTFKTAVLTDTDVLAEEIDRNFTVLNRVLANQARTPEEGGSFLSDISCDMTFTAFDTLNGDTTYTAGLTGQALYNAGAFNGDYTVTMSDTLAGLLVRLLAGYSLPEEEAAPLIAALQKIELSCIVTQEGLAWVRSPLLDLFAGEDNIWLEMDLSEVLAENVLEGPGKTMTIGQSFAAAIDPDDALSWMIATMEAEQAAQIVGDQCFAAVDGVSVLHLDQEALEELAGDYLFLGYEVTFKELDFTLTVDEQGNTRLSVVVHTQSETPFYRGVRLELSCDLSADRVSISVYCHMANVGELQMTLDSSLQATSEQPAAEPPADATVVDSAEFLNF